MADHSDNPAAVAIASRMGQVEALRDNLNDSLDAEMVRLSKLMRYELSWSDR